MYSQLHKYQENNTLLYITYVVQKIGRRTIWGRILQIVEDDEKVLIYNVDNKSVEQLNIHQIDDISL